MKTKFFLLVFTILLSLACVTLSGTSPTISRTEPADSGLTAPVLTSTPAPTSTPVNSRILNKDNYKNFSPLYKWNAKDNTFAKVNGIVISSQTERIALITQMSDKYTLRLYDFPGNLIWMSPLEGKAANHSALTFSPDGKTIALGMDSGKIQLWDTENGDLLNTFPYHFYTVHVVAFSPNGQMLASGASDQKLKLWMTETGMQIPTCFYWDPITKQKCREDNKTNVYDIAFSPDGKYIAVSSHVVVIVDVESGQEVDRYYDRDKGTTDMFEVAFSPDGTTLAASGKRGNARQVLVWDFPSGAQNPTVVPVGAKLEDLVFTPDNDLFLGSYEKQGILGIFDMKTRMSIGKLPLGPKLYMSYANDLSKFVVLSEKFDVDVWGMPE